MSPVVLIDGECGFCNRVADFVIRRDPGGSIRFSTLELARDVTPIKFPEGTVALLSDGRLYFRSEAAIRLAGLLRRPWCWLRIFLLVPAPVRDAIYDFVAKNRYRISRWDSACSLPGTEVQKRFLGEGELRKAFEGIPEKTVLRPPDLGQR